MSLKPESNRKSHTDTIVALAARGDGITGSGDYIPGSAPGDTLHPDGGIEWGEHHIEPVCRHHDLCGGCQLQHIDTATYQAFLEDRVAGALTAQGLGTKEQWQQAMHVPHISAPQTRRRIAMRAVRKGKQCTVGFNSARSHRVIDLKECHICHPDLWRLVDPLRRFLMQREDRDLNLSIDMTMCDQGVDLTLGKMVLNGLSDHEAFAHFARENNLARLSVDQGYGPETLYEPQPVTVTFGSVAVSLPQRSFLQATMEGQAALIAAADTALKNIKTAADLFAGLGTFALGMPTPRKIYAAEGGRDAIMALKNAAAANQRPVFCEHRDLYRRPLAAEECNRFEGILLDPPRAGAKEQIAQITASTVPVIAYISCNPATFARDAKALINSGYKLEQLWPIGQFLWSTHVELVGRFVRQ